MGKHSEKWLREFSTFTEEMCPRVPKDWLTLKQIAAILRKTVRGASYIMEKRVKMGVAEKRTFLINCEGRLFNTLHFKNRLRRKKH